MAQLHYMVKIHFQDDTCIVFAWLSIIETCSEDCSEPHFDSSASLFRLNLIPVIMCFMFEYHDILL